jgi:acetyltransferase
LIHLILHTNQITAVRDSILGFPPLNERLAYKMLTSLKIWPLLQGYRGKPQMNIDGLIEMIIRLSYIVTDYPEIRELDINPLLVTQSDVIALDARVILDREIINSPIKPYSHLVLRPYPEEYVKKISLHKHELTLRPIKPEDEPLWFDLLGSCSKESLYTRFRSFFDWRTHQVASRYCFID